VNDIAQVADSSEYGPGEITVTIERSVNGGSPDEDWPQSELTRYVDTNKPAGTFYSPDQVLYSFPDTLLPGYDYKLVIKNNKTGKKVEAETPIIQDFWFAEKNYWNNIQLNRVGFYNNGFYTPFKQAEWNSGVNGRRYQLTVRFHYIEIDLDNSNKTTEKSIDWQFPTTKAPDLKGGDELGTEIDGEDFYKFVASKLEPKSVSNNVDRCIGRGVGVGNPAGVLDFIVDAAGEDFNTYLEVNEPSTGIVQERPEYTNVFDENGNQQAGFFSCRYSIIAQGAKLNESGNNGNSITELKFGQYTSTYGFITKEDNATCPF